MAGSLCLAALPGPWLAPAGAADPSPPPELHRWTGKATPSLALPDAQGKIHRLTDYRGKTLLINFWATWCEPCREEMPALSRLAAKQGERNFVLLTVNVGDSEQKAAAFLAEAGLTLPVLFDKDSSLSRSAWKVGLLPASFILDAGGRILYTTLGELNWDDPAYAAAISRVMAQ